VNEMNYDPRHRAAKDYSTIMNLRVGLAASIVVAFVAVFSAVMVFASTRPDAQDRRQECMYEAVRAFPEWPTTGDRTVLGTIEPCKDLPEKDRTEIRKLLTDFVNTSNYNHIVTGN